MIPWPDGSTRPVSTREFIESQCTGPIETGRAMVMCDCPVTIAPHVHQLGAFDVQSVYSITGYNVNNWRDSWRLANSVEMEAWQSQMSKHIR